MKVVEFYRGGVNQNGYTLQKIMTWSNGALDMDHDWIQWVFPSNEPSMFNDESPVLTKEESIIFQESDLKDLVKQSFIRFLDFLGFKFEDLKIVPKDANLPWWLRDFNHTMLRVTRVLKCLRLTGNEELAIAFYNVLCPFQGNVSTNVWNHWHNAVFKPLWKEKT